MWDRTITSTINLGGDVGFKVTTSLEITLRNIRKPDHAITIWIDAICINQQEIKKRNHQVTMMRDIYSKAAAVRVWIDIVVHCYRDTILGLPLGAFQWLVGLRTNDLQKGSLISNNGWADLSRSMKLAQSPSRHPLVAEDACFKAACGFHILCISLG